MRKNVLVCISRLSAQVVHTRKSRFTRKRRIRTPKPLRAHKSYTYERAALRAKDVFIRTRRLECTRRMRTRKSVQPTQSRLQGAKAVQPTNPDCYSRFEQIDNKKIPNIMARGEKDKSTQVNRDRTKARKVTAPISLKDLMEKEVQ